MKFYYYTHSQYALDAILNETLKLSHIHLANDPFELSWKACDNIKIRDWTSIETGMLCFSKNFSNPLMWGHYSDNHKGICLGFEINEKWLTEVNYIKDRHEMKKFVTTNLSGDKVVLSEAPVVSFNKVFKSLDWAYEQEFRMYCKFIDGTQINNDLHLISFKKAHIKLKEVILGLRCPIDYINLFRTIERKYSHKVKIYNTKVSEEKFEIELNKQIDWVFDRTAITNINR